MPSKSKKATTAHAVQADQATTSPIHVPPSINMKSSEVHPVPVESTNGHHIAPQPDSDLRTGDTTESAGEPTPAPTVNRKKQKRREKEAAKRQAEEQLTNGYSADQAHQIDQIPTVRQGRGPVKGYFTEEPDFVDDGFHDSLVEPEDAFYSGDEDGTYAHDYVEDPNNSWLNTSKRKKNSRNGHTQPRSNHHTSSRGSSGMVRSALPALSNAAIRSAHKMSNEHIWNTSTQAERENIKQFWLELGEEERRSLVKVEKEAVLRKMKEQQKHSCSCSVCGRKRTAIEEELEVLYDAYYEELEQFANHNGDLPGSPQVMPPPRSYRPLRGQAHPMAGSYPVSGRIRELGDNDEELDDDEDDYDDEEDDDEPYSDEEYDDELPPGPPDFFQFGNSLTVKDGILTVADDLLKNDGKHFIDMMEQLAERRMQREEEIHYPAPPLAHQNMRQGHNHPPIDEDDDYDDDEDDEDYDSQEEDDFEGDEMDSMTEEQRMEEGRRMFQIFAARMFEQRVLTAYREKVAAERQRKLLEELDEESRLDDQREAKKAREAAKKKEKKAKQKAAKEEEKARKDAEKAAQEAAIKAAEERKLEEQRKRKEEQRKKREAEKKAAEEDRQRKEADKLRRAQEERERQAENERKQRDMKEKEKKKREEARRKEREEREAKEKEAKEQRAKEEQERKAQQEHTRKQREEAQRAERDAKGKEQSSRPQPIALPPGLQPLQRNPQLQSPLFQVATPIVPPNVPMAGKSRQPSQPSQASHPSHTSSPKSQKAGTETSYSSASPASTTLPQTPGFNQSAKSQAPPLHHPQPSAPRSPLNSIGRGGHYPYPVNGMPGLGVTGPPNVPGMMPGMTHPMHMYPGPPMGNHQKFGPNGMNYPPGFGGPRAFQPVQSMPFHQQHAGQNAIVPPVSQPSQAPGHSRQTSQAESNQQHVPISRPGPIARPTSTTPDKQKASQKSSDAGVEQITTQLGSKALLDDTDEPILSGVDTRTNLPPVGAPGTGRLPFASTYPDPKHAGFGMSSPSWNTFGSPMPAPGWNAPGTRPSPGWPHQPFGSIGGGSTLNRPHAPRPIAVRLMLVQACRRLSSMPGAKSDGFHPVSAVLQQLDQLKPQPNDPPVSMDEMLAICDTEGNVQNGGGSFEVIRDNNGHQLVKHVENSASGATRANAGDIGSPLSASGSGQAAPFGSIGQGFGPPGRHF